MANNSNATIAKKDKKQRNGDLSHMKSFTGHKKSYYLSKYLNRELKN